MATTRYLTALDFSDWNTQNVLKKHAKNRPLGQLEWRYRYTQEQPLLSCRTVEVDASGGAGCGDGSLRTTSGVKSAGGSRRSVSPSSSDVWRQQQTVLKQLLQNGGRAVKSAPGRPSQDTKGTEQITGNGSTRRGRPSTSLSMSSTASRPKSTASSTRFKSAGRPKSSASSNSSRTSEAFMVVTVDKDMLSTRRTYRDLNNRIHAHWRPGSSDLNQGHFRRGQKRPDDVPTASDAWLTFGGATEEGSEGVIDAFANTQSSDLYYNIVGSVGSRVAQQLRKGDKIRIGINGEVVSHDLRVKRWVKDKQDPDEKEEEEKSEGPTEKGEKEEEKMEVVEEEKDAEEEKEEEEDHLDGGPGSEQENPPSPASYMEEQDMEFGELIVDSFDILDETPTEEDEKDDEEEEEKEEKGKEREEKKEKDLVAPTLPTKLQDRAASKRGGSRPASSKKTPVVDFPLNWDDQVSRPEVKVISARRGTKNDTRENLCETHPVVYHTLIRCPHTSACSRPRLSSSSSSCCGCASGYRIRQRPLSSTSSSGRGSGMAVLSSAAVRNRLDSASGNKVRAITIDQNTEAEERRLQDMSIEDVIQTRLEIAAASSPLPGAVKGRVRSPLRSSPSLSPRSQGSGREEHKGGGGGEFRKGSPMGAGLHGRQQTSTRGEGSSSSARPLRPKGSGRSQSSGRGPPSPNRSPTTTITPTPSPSPSPSPYAAHERRALGVPRPASSALPYYNSNYNYAGTRGARDLSTVSMRPQVMSSARGGRARAGTGAGADSRSDRQAGGKGSRPVTGLPQHRGPSSPVMGHTTSSIIASNSNTSCSIMAGPMPGDPYFIQISQPIRNPNASRVPLVSSLRSSFFYSPFPVNSMAASPVPPSPPPPPHHYHHVAGSSLHHARSPTTLLDNVLGGDGLDMMTNSSDVFAALSRPLTPSIQGDPATAEEYSSVSLQAGVAGTAEAAATKTAAAASSSSASFSAGNGKDPARAAAASPPVPGAAALSASASASALGPGPPVHVHVMQAINIPTGSEEQEEDDKGSDGGKDGGGVG